MKTVLSLCDHTANMIEEALKTMDDMDDLECANCHELYDLRGGCDPTKYCDSCAHEIVERLEGENSALVAALQKYGKHGWDCNWNVTQSAQIDHTCTCGFEQALASAKQKGDELRLLREQNKALVAALKPMVSNPHIYGTSVFITMTWDALQKIKQALASAEGGK